ncbi:MAG: thiol reductant ABC exporter subunit CydD [Burkholderiaceae bacterium]
MTPDATHRQGALLQASAALLWLPQAALLALALQRLADGGGLMQALGPAAMLLLLGVLRHALDAAGARRAFEQARAELSQRRDQAIDALAAGSPLDSARPASGLAAQALAEQADALVPYRARYHSARLRAALLPPLILLAVLWVSWAAALVLMLAAPLIPVFMALIGARAQAASAAQMLEAGGMNALLLDRLRGLATIRALDAVDLTARRLRASAELLRRCTLAVLRIAFLSSAVLELFAALGVAMVAVYVGFHLLGQLEFGAWGDRLTLGEGLFVLLLAPAFFEPLRELSAVWHDRAAGEAALAALQRLSAGTVALPGATVAAVPAAGAPAGVGAAAASALPTGIDADPRAVPAATGAAAVDVAALRWAHAGAAAPVLDGFEMQVAPGERVAIVGASGAGKSTLLALLAGLAPLQDRGRISIDAVPLADASAASLRRRIAWIGQRPHLFARSLHANLTLARAELGESEVEAALRCAALLDLAREQPGRRVGEGGAGLSGGEALRLALARAAVDPHTTLVLADEPTAHLDGDTARTVTEGLLALAVGRTLIVATHDPRLAARMDRVVALEPRG